MGVMGNTLNHRVNNIKARIQGYDYLGQKDNAEKLREVVRMMDRGHIKTLTELNQAMKKRSLNF